MKLGIIFGLFLAVISLPSTSQAQADPCQKEAEKYCEVYKGKDPRKYYCLQKVKPELSNACSAAVNKLSGTMDDFYADCSEDFHKFCARTTPGSGRIVECLRKNSRQVSFECRKKLGQTP